MKQRRLLSLVLALTMSLSLAACGGGSGDDKPSGGDAQQVENDGTGTEDEQGDTGEEQASAEGIEYLNLDSQAPIIKDEFKGTVKPRVLLIQSSIGGKWDEVWLSQYLEARYNLEFEVESVLDTAWAERKSTLMASGDLPDIIMNPAFTTTEIYKYGQQEQLFLACDQYISQELTPNIYRYFQEPDIVSASSTPDGHVYSLPNINQKNDVGSFSRYFMNEKVIKDLGMEMPKTLEEFNEVVYALKEKDPAGQGAENVYPIGGGVMAAPTSYLPSSTYILNALGYVGSDNYYGDKPSMRNGEVVIPAYDTEVYKEFLTIMNQYYKDGIINPNYFTFEDTEAIAQLSSGQSFLYGAPVYVTGMETWDEWNAVYPLTSEWNDTPQWPAPSHVTVGNFVISAETEYPELCMRFADIFYAEDCRDMWSGPGEDSEYNFGYVNTKLSEDGGSAAFVDTDLPEGVDLWTYLMHDLVGFLPLWGALNDIPSVSYEVAQRGGTYQDPPVYDLTNPDQQYRSCVAENLVPYATEGFPTIYYLDDATNDQLTDLKTVIEPYIQEQMALFVTGQRPIEEVEQFAGELESMGIQDLLKIYQDIYAASKAN